MLPISLSRLCLSLRSLFQHHQPAQQVTTETTTVRGSQGSGSPPLSLSVSSIASPASSTTMYSRKPKSPFDPPPPTQHQQAPYRLSISGASPLHHRTSSPVIFLNLRQNQPLTLSQIYQNLMNLRINDPNVAFQCHELPLVERFDAEGSSEICRLKLPHEARTKILSVGLQTQENSALASTSMSLNEGD